MGTDGKPLQMARRVHASVQDADHRDAIVFDAEIDEMPPDGAAPVAGTNMAAIGRLNRRLGERCASILHCLRVTHGLFQALLLHGVVEDSVHVILRGRAEAKFGHAPFSCRAARACGA